MSTLVRGSSVSAWYASIVGLAKSDVYSSGAIFRYCELCQPLSGLKVIPAVGESGVPFAVVQRPSKAFVAISQYNASSGVPPVRAVVHKPQAVTLTVNGTSSFAGSSLAFVECCNDLPPSWKKWLTARIAGRSQREKKELPHPPCLAPQGLFICTSNHALLEMVVGAASSFSTSLGPGISTLAQELMLASLPVCSNSKDRPGLFAGENDLVAVAELARHLDGRANVVKCMVDRICTDRIVEVQPNGRRFINVKCEPHRGTMVVLSPPQAIPSPPFGGANILVSRVASQSDYLCRRKLLIVNGLHTTLAFLTLAQAVPRGTSEEVALVDDKLNGKLAALPLIKLDTASQAQRRLMWCWSAARLLVLLNEVDVEVIQSAHGVGSPAAAVKVLVNFALETLGRFDYTEVIKVKAFSCIFAQ